MNRQARILLLCDDRPSNPNTVLDHIDAFKRLSQHSVRTFNPMAVSRSVALDLEQFDVVVIHYSIVLSDRYHMSADMRDKLRRYSGLKVQFIQDDYRWVDRSAAASRQAGITVLFTVAGEPAASKLYDPRLPGVRRVHTLTGYVPDGLADRPPVDLERRTIDVGYRGRDLPFWLGRLAQEKTLIGRRFAELATPYRLRCDIAWREPDRIYGSRWTDFVSSCRATLGTESGASIADFDGSVEEAVRGYLRAHPGAEFDEVEAAVLQPFEGNVVVNVVSPRIFEAAALRTAMVMFPGEYSGVVSPGDHYIVLNKDFSNLAEVIEKVRDDRFIGELTKRVHHDLIASGRWSYRSFIRQFDQVMSEEISGSLSRRPMATYRLAQIERTIRVPGPRVRFFRAVHALGKPLFRRGSTLAFTVQYGSQIEKAVIALRFALSDRAMRPLLWIGARSGLPMDRLLRELLELSVLKRVVLQPHADGQDFVVKAVYEPGSTSLRFVSTPAGSLAAGPPGAMPPARPVIHTEDLKIVEWDHRALGGLVHIDRPALTIGIGSDGLERFTLLTAIARAHPEALDRNLRPLLESADRQPVGHA